MPYYQNYRIISYNESNERFLISESINHKKDSEGEKTKRSASKSKENKKGKTKPIQRRTCDITIVADHLFFHQIGEGSVEKTVLQMLWHVKVCRKGLMNCIERSDSDAK